MQFNKHETDLYILPENTEERNKLKDILTKHFSSLCWTWQYSDVEGQSWFKKMFVDIPFGIDLKEKIKDLMEVNT